MGILERIGETANKKKAEVGEAIAKEERYAAYKHPDVDYIVHGQKPFGPQTKAQSEESDEFASRSDREKQAVAERNAAIKKAAGEAAGKASRAAVSGAKYAAEEGGKAAVRFGKYMLKPAKGKRPQMFEDAPMRQERAPPQRRRAPQQDVFGWGDGGNSGTIQIFGSGGSSVLRHSRQSNPLDMGFGTGRGINPLGTKKGKQIRIW